MLKKLRIRFHQYRKNRFLKNLHRQITNYYNRHQHTLADDELKQALAYFTTHNLCVLPYDFTGNYKSEEVSVAKEQELPYVIMQGKKLFFKYYWSNRRVQEYYSEIAAEQDLQSPHCYLSPSFNVSENDVVLDLGAAEGNFSLSVVDRVKKVILFEYDTNWSDALLKTFEPWKHKTQVIHKMVSDTDSETTIRLDSVKELFETPLFIKIDVDGSEQQVLSGMQQLLQKNKNIKLALCTYHAQNDAEVYNKMFRQLGYSTSFANGYMLFYHDKKMKPPFVRRGVLRAVSNPSSIVE
jgi:23S rRNA U2552 (ribose-2'-O)-methylase RlmE/FtsJ